MANTPRYLRRRIITWSGIAAACVLLTGLTQIGGVVLVLALVAAHLRQLGKVQCLFLFCLLYAVATILVVPWLAPLFGRVPLACGAATYQPQSLFYCAANRHYVKPVVKDALARVADRVEAAFPGTRISYLDAGFPFGFMPMLPHLSHGDGRKLDLALFYEGRAVGGTWPIGYWAFPVEPQVLASPCARDGFFRWRMAWLQPLLPDHRLDERRSRLLVEAILAEAPHRVFLEPHLVARLKLQGRGILFAGCHAARHDDHVHAGWID